MTDLLKILLTHIILGMIGYLMVGLLAGVDYCRYYHIYGQRFEEQLNGETLKDVIHKAFNDNGLQNLIIAIMVWPVGIFRVRQCIRKEMNRVASECIKAE